MAILDNTLGWYSLDSRYNLYGQGPNFTEVGTPSYSAAKVGSGLVCSSGNYLTIPNAQATAYQIGLKSRSYSFWANVGSLSTTTQFFRFGANGPLTTPEGVGLLLGGSGEQLARIKFPGVGWIGFTASSNITTSTWYHFVLVVDRSGSMTLYRDGSSVGSVSISSHSALSLDTTDPFYIGGTWSSGFDGTIDEFVVYDGVLSASDISALYNSGSGISYWSQATAQSEVYYDLDDLSDVRGRHHADLTNVGSATFVTGKVGDCVDLDGSTQRLESSHAVFLNVGDEDFGGACWINPDAIGSGMGVMGQSNSQYSLQVLGGGAARIRVNTSGGVKTADSTLTMSAGTWYFASWYHNAATDEIGVSLTAASSGSRAAYDTATTSGGVPVSGTNAFTIGSIGSGNLFNGKIDQVYFVRGAIPSSTDLDAWFNSGSGAAFSSELELDYAPAASGARKVKIQAKAAQIDGSSSITGIPLVIDEDVLITNVSEFLDADGANPATIGSIRLSTDSAGANMLPIRIHDFSLDATPANSTIKIRTLTPTLDGASGTDVYLWWMPGGPQAQPEQYNRYGARLVFPTEFDLYLGFEDDPSDGGEDWSFHNQTSNIADIGSMTSADEVAGQVGNATAFDSNDGYQISSPRFPSPGTDFWIGVWANPTSLGGSGFPSITGMRHTHAGSLMGLFFDYSDSSNKWRMSVMNTAGAYSGAVSTTDVSFGSWQHVMGFFDDSAFQAEILVNGTSEDTDASASGTRFTASGLMPIAHGRFATSTNVDFFNGSLDELWLYRGDLTSARAKTLYNNQNSPTTFWDSQWEPTDGDGDGMGGAAVTGSGADVANIAESASATTTLRPAGADGGALSESATATVSASAITGSASDAADIAENASSASTLRPSGLDGIALSEAATATVVRLAAGSDGASLSEVAQASAGNAVAGSDGGNLSESASVALIVGASGTDGASLSELASAVVTLRAAGADQGNLSESGSYPAATGYLDCSISIYPALSGTVTIYPILSGTVTISPDE